MAREPAGAMAMLVVVDMKEEALEVLWAEAEAVSGGCCAASWDSSTAMSR